MEDLLERIVEENRYLANEGKIANYIPALSSANIDHIGLCIVDSKGFVHKIGDYNQKFTLQSISKVITFILAIMDNGLETVFEKVGCESTDEPFNAFTKLDLPNIIKPANPMINSGAIVMTSLIKGEYEDRFNRILELARIMTNNPNISFNREVYLSEKATGNRNRAIAYLMSNKGILEGEVELILDTYFKQCSIEVDSVDLAYIGKFISDGCKELNISTITNEKLTVLIKSILLTCGMYNYSSKYALDVGIPSKSGVSGGLVGVIPNNIGIGIYSPALDSNGNSIVGLGILKSLSEELNLSIFNN